ncbi:LOW QUALITY PROTEIN: hypothetical protein U9M48_024760 [Paspalum notatum var. saurae]|uniref:Integrase catalytic domain-containing protein n=1 Tax=Paspalum notatum var. saurae TaxID=547442 RepID=A0AAQ3TP95_PASNO
MAPAGPLNPIVKPWPFRGWGMDMIGQLNPPTSKGHKWILVATDYFTKWVEAVPMKNVTVKDVVNFVKEQFTGLAFHKLSPQIKGLSFWLRNSKIRLMAEASNKSLIKLIKRKIDEYPKQWHDRDNKARVAKAYNRKVKPKNFKIGDLVWELVLPVGTKDSAFGKWSPNWHGPYRIVETAPGNSYRMETLEGVQFFRNVNGKYLKKYYPSMWIGS